MHLSKIFLELLSDLTVVDQVILALIGELITQTSRSSWFLDIVCYPPGRGITNPGQKNGNANTLPAFCNAETFRDLSED